MLSEKPTVLFYNFGAKFGGAEIVLLKFLEKSSEKVDYRVLLNEYGIFYDRLVESQIPVDVIPTQADQFYSVKREQAFGFKTLRLIPSLLTLFFKVIKYFRAHRFDLIVSNTYKSHVILGLAARCFGFNSAWRFHDIIQREYEYNQFSRFNILLMKWLIPGLKSILPVSHAVQDSFVRNGFDPGLFRVVHNGLDISHPKTNADRNKPDKITIGWIGQFTPWKGLEEFITLSKSLIDGEEQIGSELNFVIAGSALFGDEAYEDQIKVMVGSPYEDRYTFLGHIADIDPFYGAIQIYFHTSTAPDPFPTTILEAGSRGLLVFASKLGGAGEIIRDGIDGYLIDPGDSRSTLDLAVKVLSHYTEERLKGALLQTRIAENFSTAQYRSRFETEISALLDTNTL